MIMLCVSTVVEDCRSGRKMKTLGINMPSGFLGKACLSDPWFVSEPYLHCVGF